ncbi:hypothetical protein AB0P21_13115 [Kribbella sp. NPDC056861]|uniref:hypothetical protein n=1 Tax=Kribbella sp. NPDC056861 TaxID=3154857 RepID=UPI00343DC1F4
MPDPQPPAPLANTSVLGRLLEEISWEGRLVRGYRNGGRGRENVLTAEVLGPLSYLPRSTFLAAVFRAAHGADETRELLAREAEQSQLTLLPDESTLSPGGTVVQPDGLLTTPSCHVLIESKGMGKSAFQREQLSREYLCVLRDAGPARPLLLLIIPNEPPVPVKGHGRLSIEAAINLYLEPVLARTAGLDVPAEDVVARIPESVAWLTWSELQRAVADARIDLTAVPASVAGTVERLKADLLTAIDWHSQTARG